MLSQLVGDLFHEYDHVDYVLTLVVMFNEQLM